MCGRLIPRRVAPAPMRRGRTGASIGRITAYCRARTAFADELDAFCKSAKIELSIRAFHGVLNFDARSLEELRHMK